MAIKSLSQNKKARHDYFILEEFEAGIELVGTEVKSVRKGSVNLKDSYVDIRNGEAFILGMHISPYEKGNIFNSDPLRTRKILIHKKEIMRLLGKLNEKGFTLIPTEVYLKDKWIKLRIALCQGKKLYDKRDTAAKRDAKRDMERIVKERNY